MNKYLFLTFLFLTSYHYLWGQTLFTIGKDSVSEQTFLSAYNNEQSGISGLHFHESISSFLPKYIAFRLKLLDAYTQQLNQTNDFKSTIDNFKYQVAQQYLNENNQQASYIETTYQHSLKDLEIEEIYVHVLPDGDTTYGYTTIMKAYHEIQQGVDFQSVAEKYSNDVNIVNQKGYLGYIGVFTFSYPIEALLYNTPVGQYSMPYHSSIGYHIFKVIHSRKVNALQQFAQILISFTPNASVEKRDSIAQKANNIYTSIMHHTISFEDAVKKYSDDVHTYQHNGVINNFAIGMYNPHFEELLLQMNQPEKVYVPIATSFGYHIIKLIQFCPLKDTVTWKSILIDKMQKNNRFNDMHQYEINTWKQQCNFKPGKYSIGQIINYLDTVFTIKRHIWKDTSLVYQSTILFSIGRNQKYYFTNLGLYLLHRNDISLKGTLLLYPTLINQFVESMVTDYYRIAMFIVNPTIKKITTEYYNATLVFMLTKKWQAIHIPTQQNILNFYYAHQQKYTAINGTILPFDQIKNQVANNLQEEWEMEWINTLQKKYPIHIRENVWDEIQKIKTTDTN